MTDARAICKALGGRWHGGYGMAACPVCQPERRRGQISLSIAERNGKLLLYCFKSHCSFVDIARAANLTLDAVSVDRHAQREAEAKQATYAAGKLKRARAIWQAAKPITGTTAEAYLRGRGISCALPDSLRFVPDLMHGPSLKWCAAMIADVSTGGVHRTFFDKRGNRLSKNAKMMLGPCSGGAVRLSKPLSDGSGPLVVTEGIETALALLCGLLSGPATVCAALSTSGLKALELPPRPHKLVIATDGDEPGREAGNSLAMRANTLGWKVSLLPAPDHRDWADVLASKNGVAA